MTLNSSVYVLRYLLVCNRLYVQSSDCTLKFSTCLWYNKPTSPFKSQKTKLQKGVAAQALVEIKTDKRHRQSSKKRKQNLYYFV